MTVIADHAHPTRPQAARSLAVLPGLALTAAIAGVAFGLREIPYAGIVSPMILAIGMGITLQNTLGTPAIAKPGVTFTMRRVLRFAIILLGLQLTAAQLLAVGGSGLAIIAATLVATFAFTTWLGRVMGVERGLTQLIAAGTSICGASAVIATNTVTRAGDEDVAYAVACVTLFGSVAMFAYPLLAAPLLLDSHHFGLWAGASIHEIAQVVAATFQQSRDAGEFGTIAKLSRVMMLAPMVIALGVLATRRARAQGAEAGAAKPPLPWFAFGFVAMVIVNSLVSIPHEAMQVIVPLTTFLLTMALAAMGLETDIRKLRAKGLRPLLLGAASFLFIACFSLALVKLIG
ncbi:YeiH family putative sulfate export transporter [Tardiphaga alba]|uniref:YeiH family putative sulfate export transporter n=1 Tax=Tardiphaga alba TaxID=340268 RepID=A0ABX8A4C0_9BRAD|nr:YeiH family protein [Tardiphaga alba]QUS38222.1 YeiH family putative sulfate export transporter [Tardiphaga alba]